LKDNLAIILQNFVDKLTKLSELLMVEGLLQNITRFSIELGLVLSCHRCLVVSCSYKINNAGHFTCHIWCMRCLLAPKFVYSDVWLL